MDVRRVAEIEPQPTDATWLIEDLWLESGVGLLGGQAKVCKTYLAAELALAVASGSPALGVYPTHGCGSVLFYGAEDNPAALRRRFEGLAESRGCDFQSLDVFLIDAPVLRLDTEREPLAAALVLPLTNVSRGCWCSTRSFAWSATSTRTPPPTSPPCSDP